MLCGATVAIMQVPESVAFSFLAGVPPIIGLYSTFFINLSTAALGGKPGMVSGMAGALAVVAKHITDPDGALAAYSSYDRFQHYLLTMMLAGVIQLVIAGFGLARFMRIVPRPVHVGFLNGLAVVIFLAQLDAFKVCDASPFTSCAKSQVHWMSLKSGSTWVSLAYVAVTMAIVIGFPRIPRVGKFVPSSLVGLLVCTLFEHLINRPFMAAATRSVGQTAAVSGALPHFAPPSEPHAGWQLGVVLQYAAVLALIGTIEPLMALQALNAVTKTPQRISDFHQETAAQGVGNILSSLFGSVGGCTMIGQSTVNILSGARGRLSGITASLFLLCIIAYAGPAIELIPIPSLTGVVFIVIIKTFDWAGFRTMPRIPVFDSIIIVGVTLLAVFTDLAIAVAVGVVMAALARAWAEAWTLRVVLTHSGKDQATYVIHGPLNFTTAWTFEITLLESAATDPPLVLLDFGASAISDYSALHAIYKAVKGYHKAGKRLRLINVDPVSFRVLARASKWINKGQSVVELHVAHLEDAVQEPTARLGFVASPAALEELSDDAVDLEIGVGAAGRQCEDTTLAQRSATDSSDDSGMQPEATSDSSHVEPPAVETPYEGAERSRDPEVWEQRSDDHTSLTHHDAR